MLRVWLKVWHILKRIVQLFLCPKALQGVEGEFSLKMGLEANANLKDIRGSPQEEKEEKEEEISLEDETLLVKEE
jgi:hypothetical protein